MMLELTPFTLIFSKIDQIFCFNLSYAINKHVYITEISDTINKESMITMNKNIVTTKIRKCINVVFYSIQFLVQI